MARTITNSMSEILQELELENETYVTTRRINELAKKYSVGSSPSLIAHRLKNAGWLIATPQHGVWEFAPAAYAGAYSKNDPLTGVKAYMIANPETKCYLCLQTAVWAHGIADRIPSRIEIAFPTLPSKHTSEGMISYRYVPAIDPVKRKGVFCLSPESILVHMTSKPSDVRSWESALEWLPDLVYDINTEKLLYELAERPNSVKQRTGYLLQNMFPEAADEIGNITGTDSKVRFGPRSKALRNDEKWMISDTILPVSPKDMERVK